ncbi:MAG: STAS domain-containing protein [Faecalibacterium sp.]
MTIEQINQDSARILKLSGRLDTLTAPQLDAEVDKLNGVTELVLDFSEAVYISSAGLRVLLKAQKRMNAAHGTMKLIHVCPEVAEVFEITGFDSILTIE